MHRFEALILNEITFETFWPTIITASEGRLYLKGESGKYTLQVVLLRMSEMVSAVFLALLLKRHHECQPNIHGQTMKINLPGDQCRGVVQWLQLNVCDQGIIGLDFTKKSHEEHCDKSTPKESTSNRLHSSEQWENSWETSLKSGEDYFFQQSIVWKAWSAIEFAGNWIKAPDGRRPYILAYLYRVRDRTFTVVGFAECTVQVHAVGFDSLR